MATTVTKTVKSSGGDYTSLSNWEAGYGTCTVANYPTMAGDGDLVTAGLIAIAECYSMSDTTAVTINGWYATDATRYIKVYTPTTERHDGKWNTGKYIIESSGNVLAVMEQYVRIEGLQINQTGGSWNNGTININVATPNITIAYNLIKSSLANSVAAGGGLINFAYVTTSAGAEYIWNNILYDKPGTFGCGMYIGDYTGNYYIYNNSLRGMAYGIVRTNITNIYAKNNLFSGNTNDATGTFAAGTDYNATNNASIGYTVTGGGNTHDRTSQTFSFVNDTNKDFHLLSTDTGAKDFGIDLSGDANLAFTTDIDGQTRSGSWDIGADEYIAAGGLVIPVAMNQYRQRWR